MVPFGWMFGIAACYVVCWLDLVWVLVQLVGGLVRLLAGLLV